MKIPLVAIVIIAVVVGGVATAGVLDEVRKQTYKFQINCQPGQYIWNCPCSDDVKLLYVKYDGTVNQDGKTYVPFIPDYKIGDCHHKELIDRARVLNPLDTDKDVKRRMALKFVQEYNENSERPQRFNLTKRGEINVER